MARKKGTKPALTGKERTRMCRERKKLLNNQNQRVNERFEQRDFAVLAASPHKNQNTSEPTINKQLKIWANEHRVSKSAINGLLSVLTFNGISSLPKNYRTLQNTPKSVEILSRSGGQLWYNGLGNCLRNIFSTLSGDLAISLNFNIDGLPICNSSRKTLWPVLASIAGMHLFKIILNINMFTVSCSIHRAI